MSQALQPKTLDLWVADAYRSLGATATPNVPVNGNQIDVLVQRNTYFHYGRRQRQRRNGTEVAHGKLMHAMNSDTDLFSTPELEKAEKPVRNSGMPQSGHGGCPHYTMALSRGVLICKQFVR